MTAGSAGLWERPLALVLRPLLPFLPLVAGLGLLAGLLEGVGIGLFVPLLAFILSDPLAGGFPGPIRELATQFNRFEPQTRVILLGLAILVLILVKNAVQAANEGLVARIEGRIGRAVRTQLSERLLALDYAFFLQHDPARLTRILSIDSWMVTEASRSLLTLVPAAASLLVFAALLAWLDIGLFAILLVGAGAIQLVLYGAERRQKKLSAALTASDQTFWNRFLALVEAPRVIRVFGQRDRERERVVQAIEGLQRSGNAVQHQLAVMHALVDSLIAVLFLVLLLAGYWSGTSIPVITAFLLLAIRAQPQAKTISSARLGLAAVHGSIGEVEWLLSQQPPRRKSHPVDPAFRLDQPIIFTDVSFRFPNGAKALDAVTMTIQPGTNTALIGKSGAGKTTIVNLLCRLVEPQSGTISLGQTRAADLDLQSWRSRVAIAGQDSELVTGSVEENIAYGCPDATSAEIEDAARAAGADRFIADLPHGYATSVGPNGLSLSGGQRQRIGLARALLRQPDLLILDEATNAVDALSEAEIMKLIRKHRYFQTLLIISHRKSTLSACEHGIVLDNGRVREAGLLADLDYFKTMGDVPS